jgi:hypothetical protein
VGDWDFGGFLWEDGGPMVDLNSLVSPGSAIQVGGVQTINDHGDIAAVGFDANSNAHALLLIPCDENHGGVVGCDYSLVDAAAAAHTVHAHGCDCELQKFVGIRPDDAISILKGGPQSSLRNAANFDAIVR